MEAADACEIARLPEEILSAALSLTTPLDALRAAAVSRAFRVAADSDAVWSRFLPRDLPPLSPAPPSKRELFLRLSNRPALLTGGLKSMWLDRETGAKCYMLSARALRIAWGDTPRYWRWIPLADSRSSEAAELLHVCWLEVGGKIDTNMLSRDSTYAAYLVYKIGDRPCGLACPPQDTSITVAGSKSTQRVRLQLYDNEDEDENAALSIHGLVLPQKRSDGWMELKMGEFYNKDGDDGEVFANLLKDRDLKSGLIVQGIEFRPKKGLVARSCAH